MPLRRRLNVRVWLKADIQRPEIDVCFTPNNGHFPWPLRHPKNTALHLTPPP